MHCPNGYLRLRLRTRFEGRGDQHRADKRYPRTPLADRLEVVRGAFTDERPHGDVSETDSSVSA